MTLPAGQDPDDLIRASGPRRARRFARKAGAPGRPAWRHEVDAEPLDTPEQRAGLRRRLIDHVAAIGDPDVRDQYRARAARELRRVDPRARSPGRRAPWAKARQFVPPRPGLAEAKAVGSGGLDRHTARAVLHGLAPLSGLIADHVEAIAAPASGRESGRRLRDALLDAALSHGELDQEGLNTILARDGCGCSDRRAAPEQGWPFPLSAATLTRNALAAISFWSSRLWRHGPDWTRPWKLRRHG